MTDSVCYGVRRQPFLPKTFPCRSMTSESPANLGPFCAWRYYHFTSTLPERLRVVPCMVQSCGPQNFDDCVREWKNSLFSDKFIRSTLLSIIAPNFEPYIPMVYCLVQRLFVLPCCTSCFELLTWSTQKHAYVDHAGQQKGNLHSHNGESYSMPPF